MNPIEVALLILGVVIFVASFFVKDKATEVQMIDEEAQRENIRRIIDKEMDSMNLKIKEATDGTIEYAMEKSERSLEKITNEKIMAVSEYSTTILEEINKSHKEVMFLYDMLSDKQVDIKNTVRKAEATVKEVDDVNERISREVASITDDVVEDEAAFVNLSEEQIDETALEGNAKQNKNDMIIGLYKEGKSKVEIARELHLGVGEVTLVIDLFER